MLMKHTQTPFARMLILTAAVSGTAAAGFALLYRQHTWELFLTLAITAFTICYHFAMRLLVGALVSMTIVKRLNVHSGWFEPKMFEAPLYRKLRVKQWKDKMPTYAPGNFSLKDNSLEQIVYHMCEAEVVHEIIVVLSFVPLLFAIPWGSFPVFLSTSAVSALVDLAFVVIQRYNRPRLVRLLEKKK